MREGVKSNHHGGFLPIVLMRGNEPKVALLLIATESHFTYYLF